MLAGALAQHGRPAEGRALAQDLERAGKSTLSALCLSNVMYNSAEWARARDQVNNEPAGRLWKLHAILGLPDLKRAETVAREGARLTQDPEESLAIALAADLAGDTDRRNAWTAAAASAWVKSGDPDSRAAAAWLEAVDPPDPDLMAQGHLPTAARALLLCHAARRWPEKRDAYAPLALVFSSAPMPPCQLVRALLQP